jgi:formiminotetrahydrofolate cyclodeaminase
MYIERPIKDYLKDLAARKPAPGGGSAAALEASIGCSLLSMVLNYTISNKKYENVRERAENDLAKAKTLLDKTMRLIDEDVLAYSRLSDALKQGSNAVGNGRDRSLQSLYKKASDVPFSLCKIIGEAILICKGLVEYGNKNLVTDTAIAALMLESAFFGAKFNAYINLKYIKDEGYLKKVHEALSELEEKIPALKEEILHCAEGVILR